MCIINFFQTYTGEPPKGNECQYHPGVPIFHEGLKFWSCCQRKTTDFQAFLNQVGCTIGDCKWKKDSVRLFMKLWNLVKIEISRNISGGKQCSGMSTRLAPDGHPRHSGNLRQKIRSRHLQC